MILLKLLTEKILGEAFCLKKKNQKKKKLPSEQFLKITCRVSQFLSKTENLVLGWDGRREVTIKVAFIKIVLITAVFYIS